MIRPLTGVRVLDVTQVWAGPYATMMLADLGAEVIKIEQPGSGDHARLWAPASCKGVSSHFLCVNRNKKSVTLNLREKEGKELFLKLAEKSDVLFENFKPGVMKKLGVDYETVKHRNEGIIYCSISGFGQNGPYRNLPAYDLIIQAIGGVMSVTGEENGRPQKLGAPQSDVLTAMIAAYSTLGALFYREKTNQGCHLDMALLDSQISLVGVHILIYLLSNTVPGLTGNAHPLLAPYESFITSTSEIVIGVGSEKHWRKFCEVTNLTHLIDDTRYNSAGRRVDNREDLIPLIQGIISEKPADYWIEALRKNGVPCAPINDVKALVNNEQVIYRDMLIPVNIPEVGEIMIPGVPWKVPGAIEKHSPPPKLGEHTDAILRELLELSDDQIADFRGNNIV